MCSCGGKPVDVNKNDNFVLPMSSPLNYYPPFLPRNNCQDAIIQCPNKLEIYVEGINYIPIGTSIRPEFRYYDPFIGLDQKLTPSVYKTDTKRLMSKYVFCGLDYEMVKKYMIFSTGQWVEPTITVLKDGVLVKSRIISGQTIYGNPLWKIVLE